MEDEGLDDSEDEYLHERESQRSKLDAPRGEFLIEIFAASTEKSYTDYPL